MKASEPAVDSDASEAPAFCGKPLLPDKMPISEASALPSALLVLGMAPLRISATLEPLFTPATLVTDATRSGRTEAT
ncbi:hypothetical protein D3C72_1843240 [compost metagenome]